MGARLVRRLGTPLATPFPALTHLFPTARAIAGADRRAVAALGIGEPRAGALQALAAAVADARIALDRGAPLVPTLQALHALPGLGPATAQQIALRVLAIWPPRSRGRACMWKGLFCASSFPIRHQQGSSVTDR